MLVSHVIAALFLASVATSESDSSVANYCPYFKNRAPSPQPNLQNCTWYKESACCLQEELEIIFYGVPPLEGASEKCQRQTNDLMCYVCSPYQNTFYKDEKLTVCQEFCDKWYSSCKEASLKGFQIKSLHSSGTEFCKARKFLVKEQSSQECFYHEPDVPSSASAAKGSHGLFMLVAIVVIQLVGRLWSETIKRWVIIFLSWFSIFRTWKYTMFIKIVCVHFCAVLPCEVFMSKLAVILRSMPNF